MNALKQEGQRVVDLFCHATGWLTADGKPWISRFLRTCITRRWRRLSPQFRAAYLRWRRRCAACGSAVPPSVCCRWTLPPPPPRILAITPCPTSPTCASPNSSSCRRGWTKRRKEACSVAYGYRTALRFTLTRRPEDDVLMSVAEQHTWAALMSPDERQILQSESHRSG